MPKLKELYEALKDKGFVLIGVHTTNSAEKMQAFVDKQKMTWPIVVDEKGNKTSKSYNVEGYPTTVLIDKTGKVVQVYLGDHPDKETIEKLLEAKDDAKDEKKSDDKKKDEKKAD